MLREKSATIVALGTAAHQRTTMPSPNDQCLIDFILSHAETMEALSRIVLEDEDEGPVVAILTSLAEAAERYQLNHKQMLGLTLALGSLGKEITESLLAEWIDNEDFDLVLKEAEGILTADPPDNCAESFSSDADKRCSN